MCEEAFSDRIGDCALAVNCDHLRRLPVEVRTLAWHTGVGQKVQVSRRGKQWGNGCTV